VVGALGRQFLIDEIVRVPATGDGVILPGRRLGFIAPVDVQIDHVTRGRFHDLGS